jgi:hypothetical protein
MGSETGSTADKPQLQCSRDLKKVLTRLECHMSSGHGEASHSLGARPSPLSRKAFQQSQEKTNAQTGGFVAITSSTLLDSAFSAVHCDEVTWTLETSQSPTESWDHRHKRLTEHEGGQWARYRFGESGGSGKVRMFETTNRPSLRGVKDPGEWLARRSASAAWLGLTVQPATPRGPYQANSIIAIRRRLSIHWHCRKVLTSAQLQ